MNDNKEYISFRFLCIASNINLMHMYSYTINLLIFEKKQYTKKKSNKKINK